MNDLPLCLRAPERRFQPGAEAAPDMPQCVIVVDDVDVLFAYREGGVWYESPHDPIEEEVQAFLVLGCW